MMFLMVKELVCTYTSRVYIHTYIHTYKHTADHLPVRNYFLYMPLLTLYTLQHALLR